MSALKIIDVPDLALSVIASYLGIEDLLKFRSVNRSLYNASFGLDVLGNININLDHTSNDMESLNIFLCKQNAIKKVVFKVSKNFDYKHWKYMYMASITKIHITNIDIFQEVCRKCPLLESVTYCYKKIDFRNRNVENNLLIDMISLSKLRNLKHFTFDGNDSYIPVAVFMQLVYSVPYLISLGLHSITFYNNTDIYKDSLQFAISQMIRLNKWEQNNVYFPYTDLSPPTSVKEVILDVDVPYDNHDSDNSDDEWYKPCFSLIDLSYHSQLERLELSQTGGPHIDDNEILLWNSDIYLNLKSLKLHAISLSEDYLLCHHLRDLSLWKCDGVKYYLVRLSDICTLGRLTLMDIEKFRDTDLVVVINKFKGLKELRLWSMNSITCAILTSIESKSIKLVEIYDCKHIDNYEIGIKCINALRKILHFNIKLEKEKYVV